MNNNPEIKECSYELNQSAQIEQVYTVSEIQKVLKISRTLSYELVNSGTFPVIRIGKSIRIPAKPFYNWLSKETSMVSSSDHSERGISNN